MSEGVNTVMLLGNLGADSELRRTQSGKPVLSFRLATTYQYWDKETDKKKETTEWHRVKMWGSRAEALAKFLKKGERIFVRGHLETSSYEKEGQKRYSTEVIASDLTFVGGKSPTNGAFMRQPEAVVATADLPF